MQSKAEHDIKQVQEQMRSGGADAAAAAKPAGA